MKKVARRATLSNWSILGDRLVGHLLDRDDFLRHLNVPVQGIPNPRTPIVQGIS